MSKRCVFTHEGGTDMLSRNICNKVPVNAVRHPKHQEPQTQANKPGKIPTLNTTFHVMLCTISQMNHQLDATLCRFYFCRVTLNVSGASAHHQEYLKTSTVATGTCVIVARQSEFLKKLVLTKVIVFKVLKC